MMAKLFQAVKPKTILKFSTLRTGDRE